MNYDRIHPPGCKASDKADKADSTDFQDTHPMSAVHVPLARLKSVL